MSSEPQKPVTDDTILELDDLKDNRKKFEVAACAREASRSVSRLEYKANRKGFGSK